MVLFEKILFPTDFSDSAEYAGRYAISIARKYSSKIYVAHVVEPFTYAADFGIDYGAQFREMEATAKRMLDDVVASMKRAGLDIEGIMLSGRPSAEIIGYAKREQVDLIVMATHGRTGVERLLLGSETEKVIRKSPCPVMTVRKRGESSVIP